MSGPAVKEYSESSVELYVLYTGNLSGELFNAFSAAAVKHQHHLDFYSVVGEGEKVLT
jgi:hypothetical protein